MNKSLNTFAVIHRLLAPLQCDEGFLPRRTTAFVASATLDLAHVVDCSHLINLDLKDCLDGRLNLRLRGMAVNTKCQKLTSILRLFLCHERLLCNHGRLDDVPNCSHLFL